MPDRLFLTFDNQQVFFGFLCPPPFLLSTPSLYSGVRRLDFEKLLPFFFTEARKVLLRSAIKCMLRPMCLLLTEILDSGFDCRDEEAEQERQAEEKRKAEEEEKRVGEEKRKAEVDKRKADEEREASAKTAAAAAAEFTQRTETTTTQTSTTEEVRHSNISLLVISVTPPSLPDALPYDRAK